MGEGEEFQKFRAMTTSVNLPAPKVLASSDEFAALRNRLDALNYNEDIIAKLLGLRGLSELDAGELPRYVWQCRNGGGELEQLILLFLLGEGLSRQQAGLILGRGVLSTLMVCGILFRREGMLYSRVVLYPCLGSYFFTDYWVTAGQHEGQVYELGTDSYVLARITPRVGVERALDLCTGSGIHSIQSALSGAESWAVDINPRALLYTELNSVLNGAEVSRFESNLYQDLEDRKFDLITANPPYVPSPDKDVLIHRSAGETGEEVPERLVAGLPQRLAQDGLFSMVLEYPVLNHETYLDRLERWLGEGRGWGIAVVSFGEMAVGSYIKLHIGPSEDYNEKFEAYLESYGKQGIEAVDFANVFIIRTGLDQPNWKVKLSSLWPKTDLRAYVNDWLTAQVRYRNPDTEFDMTWKPNLSGYYRTFWRDRDHTQGILERSHDRWFAPTNLNANEAELLERSRGDSTLGDLLSKWNEEGRSESDFWKALRGLGRQVAIA